VADNNAKQSALLSLLLLALVGGGAWAAWSVYSEEILAVLGGGGSDNQDCGGPPVVTVTVADAETQFWPRQLQTVGTVYAAQGIEVTSQVPGVLQSIAFDGGHDVSCGDVLITLDADRERAELTAAEARLFEAEREAARAAELLERSVIAQEAADEAIASAGVVRAEVAAAQAIIDLKTIQASFDGTPRIQYVDLGEYVQPGDELVSLQNLSKINVVFSVPEKDIASVFVGQGVTAAFAAFPEQKFTGEVVTLNPLVSPTSRGLTVEAEFDNPTRSILPGMFASLNVRLGDDRQLLRIPERAVSYNAYGASVFITEELDGSLVATRRFIELGERRGTKIEVTDGLSAGTRIVTGGQINLSDGSPIEISDSDPVARLDTGVAGQ